MPELALDLALTLGARELRVALTSASEGVALVGPSGAGKSTVLRVVAGLERRARGTVRFAGETWQGTGTFVPPWRRGLAWLPQEGLLFPHLSVRENLAYAARLPVEPIAELLGVAPLLDRQPRLLSGGERQRVALGRAMAVAPRLLLLDEPFSALDRPLRERIGADLRTWARERGTMVLLVSHDPADTAALADDVWELEGGGVTHS